MRSDIACGWCPDVPDLRDFEVDDRRVSLELDRFHVATSVDLREDGLDILNGNSQGEAITCATSVLSMLDWMSRKWTGARIEASPVFLHKMTIRYSGGGGLLGVGLRASLKSLVRFGSPPPRLLESVAGCQIDDQQPIPDDPTLFGFARDFQNLVYVRLDASTARTKQRIARIKQWLSSGNPCLLGFCVPIALSQSDSQEIPFDSRRDGTRGGSASVVMGYDDEYELRYKARHPLITERNQSKGAFLLRTCWGNNWGEDGYCRLPYAYLETGMAMDAWAVHRHDWLREQRHLQSH